MFSDDYYYWLTDLLHDDYLQSMYQKLLHQMLETEFTWSVPYDSNRASDGMYLRRLYARETGIDVMFSGGCAVLEMLIAMCRRCEEDLMHDPDLGDRTNVWFWDILENLGLDYYDDYNYDCDSVGTILERFLDRDYDKNGQGGAFYVLDSCVDFRKKDLWWQLNAFLEANYPV